MLIKHTRILSDKRATQVGRGRKAKTASLEASAEQTAGAREPKAAEEAVGEKQDFKVNEEGRYICPMCDKTFKTVSRSLHRQSLCCVKETSLNGACFYLEQNNILRTHLRTHSDLKGFSCDLCGTSFRTKGSLIRHNRRHTGTVRLCYFLSSCCLKTTSHLKKNVLASLLRADERPYRCSLCGQSFRESGALTRHLKALTPCTEKIRFVQYKEILVSKDGIQKGEVSLLQKLLSRADAGAEKR